ncbi:MAG: protealysin inhibitor emfourin [Angustibacter sp.]
MKIPDSPPSASPRGHCPGIIPPYLVDRLRGGPPAALDTGESQRWLRAATLDARLRADRSRPATGLRIGPGLASPTAQVRRSIYDAEGGTDLPGQLVRAEGDPATSDPAVDEAHAGLGATWELFYREFQRDSLDDAGLPLRATVHYGEGYANAFWEGEQMVFGDGDGTTFRRMTIAVDVIGHELTHGVIQLAGGLTYADQSGALNESLADVFGSLVKQRLLEQTADEADWLIGAGLFTERVQGQALRSLKSPGTAYSDPLLGEDPQPATMADYVDTEDDNGGVHINSGIPNHAFYLAATELSGQAWSTAGQIWYDALISGLAPDISFARFAGVTVNCAVLRHGADSPAARAVRTAWDRVGVAVELPTPLVVERSGGLIGQTRARMIDLTALEAAERDPWLSSAYAIARAPEPQQTQPDRFVYRVTCTGGQVTSAAEQNLPGTVRSFLDDALWS